MKPAKPYAYEYDVSFQYLMGIDPDMSMIFKTDINTNIA